MSKQTTTQFVKNLILKKEKIIVYVLTNFLHDLRDSYSKRIIEFQQDNRKNTFDINMLKRYVKQKPTELISLINFGMRLFSNY